LVVSDGSLFGAHARARQITESSEISAASDSLQSDEGSPGILANSG
jgi:hypothetical protein